MGSSARNGVCDVLRILLRHRQLNVRSRSSINRRGCLQKEINKEQFTDEYFRIGSALRGVQAKRGGKKNGFSDGKCLWHRASFVGVYVDKDGRQAGACFEMERK